MFLYYNRTPLFCLLTKVEEGLDMEEDQISHLLFPFGYLGNSSRRECVRVLVPLQLTYLCLFMVLKAVMTTVRLCDTAEGFYNGTRDTRRTRSYSPAKSSPWNVDNTRFPI